MFHNAAIGTEILPTLALGCTCVLTTGSFEPELILSAIEKWGVTITNLVPTMLGKLVNDPCISKYRCPTLKKIWYGSSAISDAILQASLKAFNADFYQFFGQAESGMLLVLKPEDHAERSQFTGREIMRADVRVVDEDGLDVAPGGVGEIISRHKPLGMDQYWGNKELTADTIVDGWIHTGDLARVEGGGYYTVVDRLKDMIISGAENIYSKEIENVLADHPAIAEAAVFAIPDDLWGEAICTAVVLKDGCAVSEQDIIDFCASRLSSYKKPKKVEFRHELPKNSAGKVTKNPLKEPYWAGRAKRV
jgi:acyl-CoA synthetase (AMP-forming)/AMP-acid ligase II